MKEILEKTLKKYKIDVNDEIINNFCLYYDLIVEWNKKFNLTAITEKNEVCFKHFLDSILPYNIFEKNAKIIDVGSGAGFPAIPLKIIRPDLEILMVDSLNKRIVFLDEVISKLNLKKISAIHARADDLSKNYLYREKFDYGVARAVAKLNTLCEYVLPFVKTGGKMVAYKSLKTDEEIFEAKKAISILGGLYEETLKFSIIEISAQRNIVLIKKTAYTPAEYPRDKNKPKTCPIF